MAEDAFGFHPEDAKKNILVVDDINDTGKTIAWLKQDWKSTCYPYDHAWEEVWHKNVKFATLVNNVVSEETVDYRMWDINKKTDPCWFVFPWETQ